MSTGHEELLAEGEGAAEIEFVDKTKITKTTKMDSICMTLDEILAICGVLRFCVFWGYLCMWCEKLRMDLEYSWLDSLTLDGDTINKTLHSRRTGHGHGLVSSFKFLFGYKTEFNAAMNFEKMTFTNKKGKYTFKKNWIANFFFLKDSELLNEKLFPS